jgi:muramoyltetrapeptide carboxypeptidase
VRRGSRVGVAALSGGVDPSILDKGVDRLIEMGYRPVLAANAKARASVFAGDDHARLMGFHQLCSDPEIAAIFFARGGHGLLRLLPRIDWELLAAHPRAYIGYSDLTPFLLEVVRRLNLVTFHGPMVATDLARGLSPQEAESLRCALGGEFPAPIPLAGTFDFETAIEGPLLGGCLSMLTATLGTPFQPDFKNSLLFWEDVGEPGYRIDRMLVHLELAGALREIKGMIVGSVDEQQDGSEGLDLATILAAVENLHQWPITTGCPSGHCQPNLTLPLGALARIEPGEQQLLVGLQSEKAGARE